MPVPCAPAGLAVLHQSLPHRPSRLSRSARVALRCRPLRPWHVDRGAPEFRVGGQGAVRLRGIISRLEICVKKIISQ